jgi:hypothetical protein
MRRNSLLVACGALAVAAIVIFEAWAEPPCRSRYEWRPDPWTREPVRFTVIECGGWP